MADTDFIQATTPLLTLTTTQRVTVGGYRKVRVSATAQAVWVKAGSSTVDATVGTAGETLVSVGDSYTFVTKPDQTHVAVIEHVAGGKASVTILG